MEQKSVRDLLHDARASLGVIQTTTEVVLIEPDLSPAVRASLDQIVEEVRRLSQLMGELGNQLR